MKFEWTLKRRIKAKKEKYRNNLPWCAEGVKMQLNTGNEYAPICRLDPDGYYRNIFTNHIVGKTAL